MTRNRLSVLVFIGGLLVLILTGMIQIPGLSNMMSGITSKIPFIGGQSAMQSTGGSPIGPGTLSDNPIVRFLLSRWGLILILVGLLAALRERIPILNRLGGWPLIITLLALGWILTGLVPGMGGMNPLDVISGLFSQLKAWLSGLLGGGGLIQNRPSQGPGLSINSLKSADGIIGLLKQYWWVLLLIGILFFLLRRGSIGGKMALVLLVVGLVVGMMFLGGGLNFNLGGFKLGGQSTGQSSSNCRAYHTVQPGETLFRIGLKYGCPVWTLKSANGIQNPELIYAGQTLCIP